MHRSAGTMARIIAVLALTSALTPPTRTRIIRSASDAFDVDAYKSDPNNKDKADDLPGAPNLSYDDMPAGPGFDELMAHTMSGVSYEYEHPDLTDAAWGADFEPAALRGSLQCAAFNFGPTDDYRQSSSNLLACVDCSD